MSPSFITPYSVGISIFSKGYVLSDPTVICRTYHVTTHDTDGKERNLNAHGSQNQTHGTSQLDGVSCRAYTVQRIQPVPCVLNLDTLPITSHQYLRAGTSGTDHSRRYVIHAITAKQI